jgi:hypothetical protein
MLEELLHHQVPVTLEGTRVEGVESVTLPTFTAGGDITVVVQGTAEAKDFPWTGRHLPVERPLGVEG